MGSISPTGKVKLTIGGSTVKKLKAGVYKLTVSDHSTTAGLIIQALGYPILSMRSIPKDPRWLYRFYKEDMDKGLIDWDDYQAGFDLFPVRWRDGIVAPSPYPMELAFETYPVELLAPQVDYVYTWAMPVGTTTTQSWFFLTAVNLLEERRASAIGRQRASSAST